MDDISSDWWKNYPLNTIVWFKMPRICWWPAEVIEQIPAAKRMVLIVQTYADDEGENTAEVKSLSQIKTYDCSDRKVLIDQGKKKCRSKFPKYVLKFDEAVKIADDKVGIVQSEEETVQQRDICCEPRKLFHSSQPAINEQDDALDNSVSTPSNSLLMSPNDSLNGNSLSQIPTRLSRSAKRPRTNSTSKPTKRKSKAAKQGEGSASNGVMESTPCNSESEDDLPAISMTQTPIKSYSSLKSIEDGEIVWVKHKKDPFWPALVVRGGNKDRAIVKFFNYEDQDYPVKNKKRILPFLCADKEKYEEAQNNDDSIRAALREAYLLLRSRGSEEFSGTPVAQYEAVKKRRSQTTPCKRITFTETSSCSSDDDEPAESAFGYDITNKQDIGATNDTTHEVDDLPIISVFPVGSLYSYDILKCHFTQLESDLYNIFKGDTPSENHRIFFDGTFKERDTLKIQNRCGPLEHLHMEHWKELQDQMIEWVTKWSKAENKEVVEMRYVADVLFPEATVRTMMKIESISMEKAWEKFLELDPDV
ncbi:PWWP domain-containing DNA repair factor 3A-like isoform X2 [Dysidea avara]|uniref:PWWP domain-containing DNA repair factor 3A-like isoform X2 n=1 Tax=Dysidea avara TaxID=196820 RepID=UPI00331E90CB